jgi:molybdenum cofactor biosynthesis enzyme MoaA
MYKYLEELVIHAKKTGYEYTYITTNGALATKDRMRTLIAGGLDSIKFSVNAGTAETYKKIHGKDEFDKVIQNIFDTIALRNTLKKDLVVFASCVETNLNSSEIEILKNVLRGGGVDRELNV